jgi:ribonuclease J
MSDALRIIPLGGLGEVGKNMTVYETAGEILVVDAGLAFPRDEHLGVDLLLPDVGYLQGRKVRAVVLTHGHEDHVGGLPYLLREVEVEAVVSTRLTLALVKSKLDEHGVGQTTELVEAGPGDEPLDLGPFRLELVRVAHSIPDSVALVIETGAGRVVHTGDWKLDHTPVDGLKTDVGKLAEIGNRGVDLLLGDSTNAERPGNTGSERLVGEAFRTLFPLRSGRILVASFASNIHRMQQAADVAVECGRKVTVIGRSMRKNLNIARNLGYVSLPEDALVSPDEASQLPPERVLVLCTGSQGEPMSALTRIAYGDHKALTIEPGDTVIISAKPVPGNELRVHDSINQLARAGAEVLHEEIAPVHVSGHACQEELRTMLSLLRPRHVMPIHGEYRMLAAHAKLAREAGVPEDRILIADNGSVVELARGGARLVDRVDAGVTFVDGLRVGDVRDVALRDRRRLADDGVLIVVTTLSSANGGEIAPPELIARGFGESDELLDELRDEADRVVRELANEHATEIKLLQEHIHDAVGQIVYDRTRRRPMVLPVVIEV